MDQAWRGPEPDDSRTFGLHRTSWPRVNGSLSVFDSRAVSNSARQIESTPWQETLARQSCFDEVLGPTMKKRKHAGVVLHLGVEVSFTSASASFLSSFVR